MDKVWCLTVEEHSDHNNDVQGDSQIIPPPVESFVYASSGLFLVL